MAETETKAEEPKAEKTEKKFSAKTLWTSGPAPLVPNPRIRIPGQRAPVHFVHGSATVISQKEYDTVMQAMAGRVWEEDIPKNRSVRPCKHCGFAPRSTEAREAHEDAHPVIRND